MGGGRGVQGWGGFLKADSGSEMEHVAYREISTKCSLMNAPLYQCYDEKRRQYGVWCVVFFICFAFCVLSLQLLFMTLPWKQEIRKVIGSFIESLLGYFTCRKCLCF